MHTLYTLGYSGWSPESLKAQLDALGAALWDIRMSPWSKTPDWQGAALQGLLGAAYAHVRDLGNKNYNTDRAIELLCPERVVARANALLQLRPLVLLCGCRDHHICHRLVASDYLVAQVGCQVLHLYPPRKTPPAPAAEQLHLL